MIISSRKKEDKDGNATAIALEAEAVDKASAAEDGTTSSGSSLDSAGGDVASSSSGGGLSQFDLARIVGLGGGGAGGNSADRAADDADAQFPIS